MDKQLYINDFKLLVKSDLYRYFGQKGFANFVKSLFLNRMFKYTFVLRLSKYFKYKNNRILHLFTRLILHKLHCKYGIQIPWQTQIGSGLCMLHFGGIVINENTVIGKNVTVSQGVTLGKSGRWENVGFPTIGDNVYIAPGAVIIGNVKVGNNVLVGANCVITNDVPDNAVVVGSPAKVISYDGTDGYSKWIDYQLVSS